MRGAWLGLPMRIYVLSLIGRRSDDAPRLWIAGAIGETETDLGLFFQRRFEIQHEQQRKTRAEAEGQRARARRRTCQKPGRAW